MRSRTLKCGQKVNAVNDTPRCCAKLTLMWRVIRKWRSGAHPRWQRAKVWSCETRILSLSGWTNHGSTLPLCCFGVFKHFLHCLDLRLSSSYPGRDGLKVQIYSRSSYEALINRTATVGAKWLRVWVSPSAQQTVLPVSHAHVHWQRKQRPKVTCDAMSAAILAFQSRMS